MNRPWFQLMAAAGLTWAAYLFLFWLKMAPWSLEILFVIVALLFWLARHNPAMRAVAVGTVVLLTLRRVSGEHTFPLFALATVAAAFWSLKWARNKPPKERRPASLVIKAVRTTGLLAIILMVGLHAIGPIVFMLDPGKRMKKLTGLAPAFAPLASRRFSPLEARLKDHVVVLASGIGERAAYQRAAQTKARDYIAREFEKRGYAPKLLPYKTNRLSLVRNGEEFFNVEAVAGAGANPGKGILIVSAHYDTAPGTFGADDNASGVAVLLEIAGLLKEKPLGREVRFVAFGTEEPPAFGTQNMGSYRYARQLREDHVAVEGLINLEMLGYYNPKPGSQLYPPFLHLFFPDHANFIAVVANTSSRSFLKSVRQNWTAVPDLPLVTAILPTVFSGVTLSDQLNFWNEGFPGVMVSDTSFFRNPNYHESSDTPETLDYAKMAGVTLSLADVVTALAEKTER